MSQQETIGHMSHYQSDQPSQWREEEAKRQTSTPYGLSQHLFWDIDEKNFDIDTNAAWIIHRVLEYGTMKDWMIIEKHFGLDKIIAYSLNFRSLDPVALSFLCFLSGAKKEDFRCYRIAQSNPTPWNS